MLGGMSPMCPTDCATWNRRILDGKCVRNTGESKWEDVDELSIILFVGWRGF